MKTLTPVQNVALGVAVADKILTQTKRELVPGTNPVDFTVRVHGTVSKGADTTGVIAQRAEPWKLFRAAMNRLNGVTIDAIVRDAELLTDDDMETAKGHVSTALKAIKADTIGKISGRVTSALTVEVIE